MWIVFYHAFNCLFRNHIFNLEEFITNLLLLRQVFMPHSWYMPMIIGMYIFIPYASIVIQRIEKRHLLLLMALVFFNFLVLPRLGFYLNVRVDALIDLSYSGCLYGLYLAIGYCFSKYQPIIKYLFKTKSYRLLCYSACILIFLLQVALGCLYSKHGYSLWYDSPLVLIEGILIFSLLLTHESKRSKHRSSILLSRQSFGVFLIHVIPMFLFSDIAKQIPVRAISVFVLALLVFLTSNIVIWITSRISSRLSYWLFLVK